MAVFLFSILFFSCKSYQPVFDVDRFYDEYNEDVDFIEEYSYTALIPENDDPAYVPENGIIFYPGGLVDYRSYFPLLTRLAENGIACFIVEMPFDFAFMNKTAGNKILKQHPEIKNWYMAGHSLGGAIAASYISDNTEKFEGLILLAAYSTQDISTSGLRVLSIYGSHDEVLNMEHYQKHHDKLPPVGKGLTEIVIDGGNHAQFASYGAQEDDGVAEISADEQQEKTVQEIISWIGLK